MTTVVISQLALVTCLLIILICGLSVQGAVQFKFNTSELAISEGGNLPNELSIIKVGQNQMNISFLVRVIPGSAVDITDYRANNEDPYTFTSSTSQLPIRTQLVGDRAGEPIENFMICLPDSIAGAEIVEPRCVTITIVDDDSVVIGFRNSSEVVMEGGTKAVCADVKPEGLRLDPFDRVPLAIQTNPASSEVQLSTSSLVFEMSITEKCASVSIAENNNMEGSRSYQLVLARDGGSTVPVELYPNTLTIIVIDNDGPDTSFSITSRQPNITILEGSRIDVIQVEKLRSTVLNYNVTLLLTGSARSNDIVITNSLIFDPSTTQKNVGIEVMEDTVSMEQREFNISILSIKAIEAPDADLANARGGPVTIRVYDNDFEIGFTEDRFLVPEDSSNMDVCVEITKPASRDIEPSLTIPITVMLENSISSNLVLNGRDILLNATNKEVCLTASHTANNSSTRLYSIQLTWTDDQAGYVVYFHRQNATIVITDTSNRSGKSGSGATAGIVVGVLLALIIGVSIVIIAVIVVRFVVNRNNKNVEPNYEESDPPTPQSDSKFNPIACEQNPAYNKTTADIRNDASYESIPEQVQKQDSNIPQQPNSHGQTREDEFPTIPGGQPTQPQNEECGINATEESSKMNTDSELEKTKIAYESVDPDCNKDSTNGTTGYDVDQV